VNIYSPGAGMPRGLNVGLCAPEAIKKKDIATKCLCPWTAFSNSLMVACSKVVTTAWYFII